MLDLPKGLGESPGRDFEAPRLKGGIFTAHQVPQKYHRNITQYAVVG